MLPMPARLTLLAAALLGIGAAPPAPEVPVIIGRYADLDACSTVVRVAGLDPRGDNYLSLRSRPSPKARELARLRPGQWLIACDDRGGGQWLGVLYDPTGKADCGTGSPVARRQPYRGPCASGWVARRFTEVIAG
ncbi:MAG TPA: hypothetical protein VF440_01110 [Novosphingobium sp.]